jgi:hypothetical protein
VNWYGQCIKNNTCESKEFSDGNNCISCYHKYGNCLKCDNRICQKCESGYVYNYVINHCQLKSSLTPPRECPQGSYLNRSETTCLECSKQVDNCDLCSANMYDQVECLRCKRGYMVDWYGKCTKTNTCYYDEFSDGSECIKCSMVFDNCTSCNRSTCLEC